MAIKKVLIATNTIGFMWFIMDDIDLLCSMGYSVTVAADNSSRETHTVGEIQRRGAEFVDVPCDSFSPLSTKNHRCLSGYWNLLRKGGFDAVLCHTPIVGFFIRFIAMTMGTRRPKIIYMTHGLNWNRFSGWKSRFIYRAAENIASPFCDAIITINDDDRREAGKLRCRRVFNIKGVGCDVKRYSHDAEARSQVRGQLNLTAEDILVLSVGRICQRKNQLVILKAIATLPDKARYCFAIVGKEGEGDVLTNRLRVQAEALGVRLVLMGFRNDVERIVQAADVGVMPSLREGLGMAAIEMMAAGVPVAGTNVQGMKEYIKDGETGLLVDNPYDEEAFARAIAALSDSCKRRSMSEKCIEMAAQFRKEVSIRQRREIYKSIFS